MAVVLQAMANVMTRVPYVKPPDIQRVPTPIPRAILRFHHQSVTVVAKPLNDQYTGQTTVVLPTTFAYRMIDSNWQIRQDESVNYEPVGVCFVTNAMRGNALGATIGHAMPSHPTLTFATIVGERIFNIERVPTYIMQSLQTNVGVGVDFRVVNVTAAAAATGFSNFYVQFYEYDIEQVQMFPPLVPQLTYAIA